jgi:hypothetical protein
LINTKDPTALTSAFESSKAKQCNIYRALKYNIEGKAKKEPQFKKLLESIGQQVLLELPEEFTYQDALCY